MKPHPLTKAMIRALKSAIDKQKSNIPITYKNSESFLLLVNRGFITFQTQKKGGRKLDYWQVTPETITMMESLSSQ